MKLACVWVGANRNNILLMVLREAAVLLGIGLVIGTGLALAAGTAVASMLYGLKPGDPLTLGAAIAGMVIVALVASLLPAQRAATVHPMEALREDKPPSLQAFCQQMVGNPDGIGDDGQ